MNIYIYICIYMHLYICIYMFFIYTRTWWHFSRVGGKFHLRCEGTREVCKREGGGLRKAEADLCIHVAEPCTIFSNVSSWWYILYCFYSLLSTFTSWLIFTCGALIMKDWYVCDWYVYYYVAKSCSRFLKGGSCWKEAHAERGLMLKGGSGSWCNALHLTWQLSMS